MPKKVMIISVSAGAGHLRAAQALEAAFAERYPDVEVENIDSMQYVTKPFKKMYADSYIAAANRMPILYGYLYEKMDKKHEDTRVAKLLSVFQKLNARKLINYVKKKDPDHIICVHYLPAEIFGKRKRRGALRADISVTVTDFAVHQFWIVPGVRNFFVGCDEVAWIMKEKGIDPKNIYNFGIPIHPVFSKRLNRSALARRFGLDEKTRTVMILSGGFGVGDMLETVRRLFTLDRKIQIISVAGRNEKLKKQIDELRPPANVRVVSFGFVDNIHELMKVSDLIVTKPGGLSVSEALAMALPMIIIFPIPGQEEKNSDYLLENRCALKADDLYELDFKLRKLLTHPRLLATMKRNARACARPRAAHDIVDFVYDSL
jgi:processive 1,2-diacylglycerol beta-glucosyltransferase